MAAALGLTVKTGRAVAVAVDGTGAAILKCDLELADPRDGETRQPYHLGLDGGDPRRVEAAVRRARRFGEAAVARLLGELPPLTDVVVVVASATPPERIGSPHMRAHSSEGWLFREICERAVARAGVSCAVRLASEVKPHVAAAAVAAAGARLGRPWRAEHKLACAAALLAVSPRSRPA